MMMPVSGFLFRFACHVMASSDAFPRSENTAIQDWSYGRKAGELKDKAITPRFSGSQPEWSCEHLAKRFYSVYLILYSDAV